MLFMNDFRASGMLDTLRALGRINALDIHGSAPRRRSLLPKAGSGCGWDTRYPPQNGARQIARYSRQIAAGQKRAANGVVGC